MPIDGRLEALEFFQIRGWAFDRSRPTETINVQILLDDHVLAEGLAGQFRDDLAENGVGDGCHAFAFELPRRLNDDETTRVYAKALGSDGTFRILPKGPRFAG